MDKWQRRKEEEIQNLRAHLMELRVAQEDVKGEIGWMVSAYVPDSVVKHLQQHPERVAEFTRLVADALVDNAIKRILKIDRSGKVQALIFENVKNPNQQIIRCRPWFEADTEGAKAIDIGRARKLADESERTRRMLW